MRGSNGGGGGGGGVKRVQLGKRISKIWPPPSSEAATECWNFIGEIYVGNAQAAGDAELLKSLSISAVVSVGGGNPSKKMGNQKIPYHHFGIKDNVDSDFVPVMETTAIFLKEYVENNKPVLIHCRGGIHRSPLIAASVLVYFHHLSPIEAKDLICQARSSVRFEHHLFCQLELFAEKCKSELASNE
jgi:protein-tyrosine phosphatase